jgi:hypothetical protein
MESSQLVAVVAVVAPKGMGTTPHGCAYSCRMYSGPCMTGRFTGRKEHKMRNPSDASALRRRMGGDGFSQGMLKGGMLIPVVGRRGAEGGR